MCNRIAAALLALLLAACQQTEPARPAIWQVDGVKGERAWLLGTIHALPRPITLDSPAFRATQQQATALVVEVAALEDDKRTALAFHRLAAVAMAPPIADRANAADRPALARLLAERKIPADRFNQMDTWAAALALSQAISAGSGGADPGLASDSPPARCRASSAATEFSPSEVMRCTSQPAGLSRLGLFG